MVVVEVASVGRATAAVAMLFAPKGVGGERGGAAVRASPQHTVARAIVKIPLLTAAACIPLDQVIKRVIREGRRRPVEEAAGDVAPGIVATGVDLSTLARARGSRGIEPIELMGVAALAVEILVLGAAPVEGSLPQLAQMRVGIRRAVAAPGETAAQRGTATGAVACRWLRSGVARPQQAVLLIVAEVGGNGA